MPAHIPSPFPESYSRISSPIPVTTAVKNMYKSIVNFQDRSRLLDLLETKYPELSSTIDLFFINELQIAHLNDVRTRLIQNLVEKGIATPLYEVVNHADLYYLGRQARRRTYITAPSSPVIPGITVRPASPTSSNPL